MTLTLEREPFVYRPTDEPWVVLYEDRQILAVVKPQNLLSVPGRAESDKDCLISRVQQQYPEVLLLHRLDLATSGILLFARTREVQAEMARAFQSRRIVKRYEACVHGEVLPDEGIVEQPLRVDWPRRPVQIVDRCNGKPSRTAWRVLSRENDTTRVALVPHTGRTHQLRVHMTWLGHPMLGDNLYAPLSSAALHRRLHLHAALIIFPHPLTGLPVRLESAVPF
ncbi:MAG: tRNA pseudouridine32 synthase/23S rRNA pseudouridine746 synthase [Bradymonadia bacterium]|jgi:tRNA pseudouridine32 synthase/23S rRNA pseudouridine746 synthase